MRNRAMIALIVASAGLTAGCSGGDPARASDVGTSAGVVSSVGSAPMAGIDATTLGRYGFTTAAYQMPTTQILTRRVPAEGQFAALAASDVWDVYPRGAYYVLVNPQTRQIAGALVEVGTSPHVRRYVCAGPGAATAAFLDSPETVWPAAFTLDTDATLTSEKTAVDGQDLECRKASS